MSTFVSADDLVKKVCADICAETGQHAHVIDATLQLPTWNGLLCSDSPAFKQPGRPSCCFRPRDKNDVLAACKAAARQGLKISARGSGHHYGGASLVEGCLLLDMSDMNAVKVDPVKRTAHVGPAVTGCQLRSAVAPLELHFPLPHLSCVGLAGYILGGGNGWGVRQWGAAADNVEEFEVVLLNHTGGEGEEEEEEEQEEGSGGCVAGGGNCRLLRIRSETHPELFWGLRGGGSFLGVVTEFVLRLHPVPPRLHLISASYPLSSLGQLAEFFRKFHSANPTCVEASLAVVAGPTANGGAGGGGAGADAGAGACGLEDNSAAGGGGKRAEVVVGAAPVVVLSCHAFAEPGSEEVEASYAKLRALLPDARLSLQEGPMPYEQALSVLDAAWNWHGLCMYAHGGFVPVSALRCSGTAALAAVGGGCGGFNGGVVGALAAAASALTSRRSIMLVCPGAPTRPGCLAAAAGAGGRGCAGLDGAAAAAAAARDAAAAARDAAAAAATAAAAVEEDDAAVAPGSLGFRDTFYVGVYGMWTRSQAGPAADGDAAHVSWVRSCATTLAPYTVGLYVNEVMHDEPAHVRLSYEAGSYERLQALKQQVDPYGLLRGL